VFGTIMMARFPPSIGGAQGQTGTGSARKKKGCREEKCSDQVHTKTDFIEPARGPPAKGHPDLTRVNNVAHGARRPRTGLRTCGEGVRSGTALLVRGR
jgi:hypothetical protein